MTIVLYICKLFIPIEASRRLLNIPIILGYSVIGMIVYFGYTHFIKLTNKVMLSSNSELDMIKNIPDYLVWRNQ